MADGPGPGNGSIVVDLDGTLTVDDPGLNYPDRKPNLDIIRRLKIYRDLGFRIVIFTSRNMRTYRGNVGMINVHTLPTVLEWLIRHDVPFDEVLVGKPWCGNNGFYLDDRAVRPEEFLALSPEELEQAMRSKVRER